MNNPNYKSKDSGYIPKPGDALIIDWDGANLKDAGQDHIEIISAVSGDKISTIGGNTGDGNSWRTRVCKEHVDLFSTQGDSQVVGYFSVPANLLAGASTGLSQTIKIRR